MCFALGIGCDGIKMLEGKPTTRQYLDIPVDSDYFIDYFKQVEATGFPLLWHVNDPEEFWDADKIPGWAKDQNWGYNETDVQKEAQYKEIDNVLDLFPKLNIIFPHFYFLSADLERAAHFLDLHPTVNLDLAPGIEFLYNMSHRPDETRNFFTNYSNRIIFGTDLFSTHSDEEAIARCGIVTRWLETDEEYRVPETADYILGPPEDGIIRGLNLSEEVLEKIYITNHERITGTTPAPFNTTLALKECKRIAAIAKDSIDAENAIKELEQLLS